MHSVPPMTGPLARRKQFVSGLYRELLENGIRYFFPGASLDRISQLISPITSAACCAASGWCSRRATSS